MKTIKSIFSLLFIFAVAACNSNSKLSQTSAEIAINEFISRGSRYFQINSVKNFGTVTQFSDNEANTILTFNYSSKDAWGNATNGEIQVKCIFKKNVDKKWIFTTIEPITSFMDWNGFYKWISDNQNMNIIAQ